jgi:hypothetical protein
VQDERRTEIYSTRLQELLREPVPNPEERGGRELSAKIVQTLLGHSSIMMTLDIMATCSATAPTEPSLLHLKKHCSAETQPKAARRPADASYW